MRCDPGSFEEEPRGDIPIFELRHLTTGALIHVYASEGAALAFVRDVIRVGSRTNAAGFALLYTDDTGQSNPIAVGEALVTRALEDRVL